MTLGDAAASVGACVLVFNSWQSWRNGRLAKKALEKVEAVAQQTDGLTQQLVRVTGDAKFKEGVEHGEKYAERNGTKES